MPRILTLMGSGELAPTMVRVHREILDRFGGSARAVLLATPFGFQENADELAARAVNYFHESLLTTLEVARDPAVDETAFAAERMTTLLQGADYVFSGPGSPTYALRTWRGGVVPGLLVEKVTRGGAVTFASAAALTLGARTIPVYEIYKVGDAPTWLDGLDVLGSVGIHCAVIPHYNNAEGGTHDTRYCYLGERRLAAMERELPEDHFVLGVDEHTSCSIDLEAGRVTVGGVGVVTLRHAGRSTTIPSGETVALEDLLARAYADSSAAPPPLTAAAEPGSAVPSPSPLIDLVRALEERFAAALADRDVESAVAVMLEIESTIHEWSTDVPGADELERARASLRAMVVELGRIATGGARDPREVVGPFVEALLEVRTSARADRRFDEADRVRNELTRLGVELRDGAEGTEWLLQA